MRRLLGLVKKEFKEILRDRGFLLAMFIEPILLMLVFGFTFSGDLKDLKTIVIDNDKTDYSEKVVDAIESSDYFKIVGRLDNVEEAYDSLLLSNVRVLFHIPQGFKDEIKNAEKGKVKVFIDSSDYMIYNLVDGASGIILGDSFQEIVQLVISDLESERNEKQERINNIQSLVDEINDKTRTTLNDIGDLKGEFSSSKALIKDTETKINTTQEDIKRVANNISNLGEDINEAGSSIYDLSSELDALAVSLSALKYIYLDPKLDYIVSEVVNTKQEVSSLQEKIDEAQDNINQLSLPSDNSMNPDYYNINDFYTRLDSNQLKVGDIEKTAHEIEATYRDIQERVGDVDLEMKSLKREFISNPINLTTDFIYGETTYFQYLTPAIVTMSLFFIGVVLTSLNIIRERTTRTFFRLATTPLKTSEFLLGKFIIFILVGLVESVYFIFWVMLLFDVQILGRFIDIIFVLFMLMGASIGLGLLVSSTVRTMTQAAMVIPLLVVPSILISQVFAPVETMPQVMQILANFTPLFHANLALRQIIIKGSGLSQVLPQIVSLFIYMVSSLLLGVVIIKKRVE